MTPTTAVITAGLVTLVLALVLPVLVKPLLVRLGVMDVPNERSSHTRPVLRGLGLATLIAMAGGYGYGLIVAPSEPSGGQMLGAIALAAVASGVLGIAEDVRGVTVAARSAALLAIGAVSGVLIVNSGWLTGRTFLSTSGTNTALGYPVVVDWLIVVYAVLFLSSYINVANFMDGLNGVSGFHGVIAGLTFAAIGHFEGITWLGIAGVVLAAGFLGFLPFNLRAPGAFLGDVGSYLLGGATAVTSLAALMAGVPILATIGPMIIYFGDVGVTLVKRMRKGYKWDEPHKEHVYQRIQQLGYSHVTASAITASFTALASLLGLASLFVGGGGQLVLLGAGLVTLGVYLKMPQLLRERSG